MSSKEVITLTPEVKLDTDTLYLIRINGEELAFADTEHEAKLVVDSFGDFEQKRLTNVSTEVFRKDLDEGTKVVLTKRSLGYLYNGSMENAVVVDFVPVRRSIVTRGRHELDNSTLIPSPDELQEICRRVRCAVSGTPENVPLTADESKDDSNDDSKDVSDDDSESEEDSDEEFDSESESEESDDDDVYVEEDDNSSDE